MNSPMTAPDSRDSVDKIVADLHEAIEQNCGDNIERRAFRQLADRLQALARGPQQAGGEDAKVRHLMKARDIALGAVQELQAEVARLQRERAELIDKLNGTPCAEVRWQQERERLQVALREAGRDAERYRWLRRKIDPDTIDAVIEDDFDLRESQSRDVDAAIDATRLVRDGDSGEGES